MKQSSKNLEMCIIFCDTSYQILLFDCDINVTLCDIFATLKNLTKRKRACESFVLKACDLNPKPRNINKKKESRSPPLSTKETCLFILIYWLIIVTERLGIMMLFLEFFVVIPLSILMIFIILLQFSIHYFLSIVAKMLVLLMYQISFTSPLVNFSGYIL